MSVIPRSSPADGGAPPLVLLHKLGGWRREWDALSACTGRHCIALDLPGHGAGPHGDAPPIVRIEQSAASVVATLHAMGIGIFDLVGTSLGGAVAVRIASAWPKRIRRLALISVALTGPSTSDAMAATDARGSGTLYGAGDMPLERSPAQMEALFGVTDAAVQADLAAARSAAGAWIRPSWRGAALADVAGWLSEIEAATTVIYGDRGGYRDYEAVARERLRDVSVAVIADSGAFPHQERPDRVAAMLRG